VLRAHHAIIQRGDGCIVDHDGPFGFALRILQRMLRILSDGSYSAPGG
jgi:hypothetical protein